MDFKLRIKNTVIVIKGIVIVSLFAIGFHVLTREGKPLAFLIRWMKGRRLADPMGECTACMSSWLALVWCCWYYGADLSTEAACVTSVLLLAFLTDLVSVYLIAIAAFVFVLIPDSIIQYVVIAFCSCGLTYIVESLVQLNSRMRRLTESVEDMTEELQNLGSGK